MAYLKPQTPLKDREGDFFYPLTTIDQVVMEGGGRLNSVFKSTVKIPVTVLADNWSNTAPYTQTITLDKYIDDLNVGASVIYTGDVENDIILNRQSSSITYIKKEGNTIIFTCLKNKPIVDIPLEIIGTASGNIATVVNGINLNFKVVGGTTEPQNPIENTIWVNTDVEITGWLFSITEPEEPVEGMVWICTGATSLTAFNAFNALEKNGIQVFPVFAKQYIEGTWVEKTEKSWQNGEWSEWAIPVFTNGTLLEGCTVGIISNSVDCSVAVSGTDIVFQSAGNLASGNRGGGFYFEPTFYVTDRKKLYVDATVTLSGSSKTFNFGFRSAPPSIPDNRDYAAGVTVTDFSGGRHEYELDISELSGYMYLLFYGYAVGKVTVVVHSIRIE